MTKTINGIVYYLKVTSYTSEHDGYVHVSEHETQPIPYKGKYGIGYTTYEYTPKTTRYCLKNYWINN